MPGIPSGNRTSPIWMPAANGPGVLADYVRLAPVLVELKRWYPGGWLWEARN